MKNVAEGHNPLNRGAYCGDPGALVSYLYNDGSPEELAAIATHVQACAVCTSELAALGDTREALSAWSPPQTELGFSLTASDALPAISAASALPAAPATATTVAAVPWWRQATPVWMQAVAASMVFAAGMAIGAGRGTVPAATTVADAGQPATGRTAATVSKTDSVSRGELADLEQRLRAELARLTPASPPAPVQTAARSDDEALLKRVRSLLTESEERQRGELALRTAQVLRDIEIQRKVDLATVQQNIGQIQGTTGEQIRQNRELYNMLMNRAGLVQGGVK